ncbi:MAG: DNA mismatch repair protein MutS, partial [Lachnospiraceae bacterium]|nr:DNA mismatch repair protein MutS [Lachnospiraceae bacterium]
MMQQYLKTKEEYKDCILFYRLGDFYEMFFDDAKTASKELELTLTGKACGMEERAPMCGVPFHSADVYLTRLVKKGYKVAICEQVEDPKEAKDLVKREVVRVVTPGTNTYTQSLDETKNNYLASVVYQVDRYGISFADVSTGDFYLTEVDSVRKLYDELNKYNPSEMICNESFFMSGISTEELSETLHMLITAVDASYFDDDYVKDLLLRHFHVNRLDALGITEFPVGCVAAGALLSYLLDTQKSDLSHMNRIVPYANANYMMMDSSTRRNLELVETMREKEKRGSLLWVLDKTKTAMGARLLRTYIERPLIHKDEIVKRQEGIEEFIAHYIEREELREYLNPVYDLERLMTRIAYQTANPRDLLAFLYSISNLTGIKTILSDF